MRFEPNRRHLIAGGLAAGLTPLVNAPAWAALEFTCDSKPRPATAKPERAVSLRRLSEALKQGKPARLEGFTRLDGFICDKENQDIVLWGLSERNQPELQLADLVVALRAAHGRYYEKRDGVTYIVQPLISIDPNLDAYRELDKIAVRDPARKTKHARVCANPQTVRVEGMPRNSRVAKVLVDADYRMKMVSQGSLTLPISSPFPGTFTVRLREWRDRIERGLDRGPGHKTRYWFEPGRFSYQYSEEADTVFLDTAQVVLRDEDQRENTNIASGKVDPISRAFACAWTARMEDVYRAEPIWRDMHNIFRLFAVSRIIADRKAFQQVAFAQDMLLDRYELPVVPVPNSLPGLGRWEEFNKRERRVSTLYVNRVCGGVSVGFTKPIDTVDVAAETPSSGRTVIAARPPELTAVSWAVTPGVLKGIFERPRPKSPAMPVAPSAPDVGRPKPPGSLKDLFKT